MILPFGRGILSSSSSSSFLLTRSCETHSRLSCCCCHCHRRCRRCWLFTNFCLRFTFTNIPFPFSLCSRHHSHLFFALILLLLKRKASDFILVCSEWSAQCFVLHLLQRYIRFVYNEPLFSLSRNFCIFFLSPILSNCMRSQWRQRIIIVIRKNGAHTQKKCARTRRNETKRSDCVFICINCVCVVCECIMVKYIHLICTE